MANLGKTQALTITGVAMLLPNYLPYAVLREHNQKYIRNLISSTLIILNKVIRFTYKFKENATFLDIRN